MRPVLPFAALLVAVGLSGCFQSNGGPEDVARVPEQIIEDATLDLSADDCDGLVTVLNVPPSLVTPWLPAGYQPRDSSSFYSSPVSTGQAMVLIATTLCPGGPAHYDAETWALGAVAIFVQPPASDEIMYPGDPAPYHFYAPISYVDSEPLWADFTRYGAVSSLVGFNFTFIDPGGPLAGVPHVSSAVAINGSIGAVGGVPPNVSNTAEMAIAVVTPAPVPSAIPDELFTTWQARFWQESAVGTLSIDTAFDSDAFVGDPFCVFREDSVAAQLSPTVSGDADNCATNVEGANVPPSAFGATFQQLNLQAIFKAQAGVFAA